MRSAPRKLLLTRLILAACVATANAVTTEEATRDLVFAPKPEYPEIARATHQEGAGRYQVFVDLQTGKVTKVTVVHSAGYRLLDDAAVGALRNWRVKPNTLATFYVPLSFGMSGFIENELRAARVHSTYSPAPIVPFSLWYYNTHSGGQYQMTVDPKTGLVADVKMLLSSRVLSFDQSCLSTLRTWRYEPHTVTTMKVWISF